MAQVLVTGAAGAIGQPVCAELLARGHRVRGIDRVHTPGLDDVVVSDLEDRAGILAAMQGVEAVVHLAAEPDDADFPLLIKPNVLGLFHVMDAARKRGVKRVVLASSVQTLGRWWEQERPALVSAVSPSNHYGLTKVWAEQMGAMYASCHGLSVIAGRVAFMVRNSAEAQRLVHAKQFDSYLSRGDVGRFFAHAVEATNIDFAVLYAVGVGGERLLDMEPTHRLINFYAQDRWPEGLGFDVPLVD